MKHKFKSGWLPDFFSFEDFILELGNIEILDHTDLIVELFEVHKAIEKDKAETFDSFINWGSNLLNDFNEIDNHLINADDLFSFLTEAKAIERWNPQSDQPGNFQKDYLAFYRKLIDYYSLLKERLLNRKAVYRGLAFRYIAEALIENRIHVENFEKDALYFIGFNALTKAEITIMNFFRKSYHSKNLWDADEYYIKDSVQEAGLFLRQHIRQSDSFNWQFNDLLVGEKELNIFGVTGDVGQAKLIASILSQTEISELQSTVIVLANETILLPVLESLPEKVTNVNVTMGYPLSSSTFYFWFEQYLMFFFQGNLSHDKHVYSRIDVINFLSHSAFQNFRQSLKNSINELINILSKSQKNYLTTNDLIDINKCLEIQLFPKNVTTLNIVESILKLINKLIEQESIKDNALSEIQLLKFKKVLTRLHNLIKHRGLQLEIIGLIQLYKQLIKREKVDFIGEPLNGLQIMGLLETRTLDFQHVIIASVNEGILPEQSKKQSFIPYDIMRKFHLPSHNEKDAVFAYHFYRLLQRASKVSLIYNTKVDSLMGGEKSRYIEQLLNEYESKNPKATVTQRIISTPINIEKSKERIIAKQAYEIEQIRMHLAQGISPTALNTFINCPLDYYYKYILKLSEVQEDHTIDDGVLGSIVHDSLEKLYYPLKGKILSDKSLQDLINKVNTIVEMEFIDHCNTIPHYGNEKLVYEVACKMVKQLISYDIKSIRYGNEIMLLELEKAFEASVNISLAKESTLVVKLKGKVDRIDLYNGVKRIIDYKTGGVLESELSYSGTSQLIDGNKSKIVQLLIYHYLISDYFPGEEISTGIISLRNISSGFMRIKNEEPKTVIQDLQIMLANTIDKLLNPALSFKHNSDSKFCSFCG